MAVIVHDGLVGDEDAGAIGWIREIGLLGGMPGAEDS